MVRRHMGKWRALLFGLVLVAAPGAAQSDDLFQSAPGPEPPRQTPRPRVSRPTPVVPQPSAIPTPEASDKLSNRNMPFDGIWVGLWGNKQNSVSYSFVMEVKDNNVAKLNSRSAVPGTPGYDNYTGVIGSDGRVLMTRHGVGLGIIPGALARGQAVTEIYDGLFSGDNFVATEKISGCCHIQLTRRR